MQALLRKLSHRPHWGEALNPLVIQAALGRTRESSEQLSLGMQEFVSSAQGAELQRAEGPTIKSQLRLLYKKVHPDLFHSHPAERATNERSFKLLQEYLTAAQEGTNSSPRQFRFEFYLRASQEELERDNNPPSPKPNPKLEKFEVTLPPPRQASNTSGELAQSTKKALSKLLAACGLAADISGDVSDDVSIQGVADLLRRAGEVARQQEADVMTTSRRAVIARNALRMGRGAKAVLQGPAFESAPDVQAETLEKLARALDLVPEKDVTGITFVLGSKYGLDSVSGNVWLRWDDGAKQWAARIASIDNDGVQKAKDEALVRKWKESQVAKVMGLEMVYTDHGLVLTEEYAEFLERLESHARARGPVAGGTFAEVPLRVSGGLAEGSSGGFEIDEGMGFASVPVGASATAVWQFLEDEGHSALDIIRRNRLAEQQLADMSAHVRKKLRLRHFTFDATITSDQYFQCCLKMLRHARTLVQLTDGLSLCIGSVDRLPLEGEDPPFVHMRWNFSMSSL